MKQQMHDDDAVTGVSTSSTVTDPVTALASNRQVAINTIESLSPQDKKDVARQLGLLPDINAATVNLIWRVIVLTFILTLLVGAAFVVYNAVAQKPTDEVPLTIFETAVAFLAGLLSPSPTQGKEQSREATDFIWRVIIIAFSFVLVGSSIVIALALFVSPKSSTDILVTVFSSSVAFLGGLLTPSPVQGKEQIQTDMPVSNWVDSSSAIGIRITDAAATTRNFGIITSALTELHTKCWLIQEGRFADLNEYTQTGNPLFDDQAPLKIGKMSHDSPIFMQMLTTVLSASGMAVFGKLIDSVIQVPLRYREKQIEVDNKFTAYTIEEICKKLELIDKYGDESMRKEAAKNLLPTLYKLGKGSDFEQLASTEKNVTK